MSAWASTKRLAGHGSSREQGHGAEMRKRVPAKRNLFIDHELHVYLTVMGLALFF